MERGTGSVRDSVCVCVKGEGPQVQSLRSNLSRASAAHTSLSVFSMLVPMCPDKQVNV